MADIMIEQALYLREGTQAPRLLGRSSGFRDEWLAEAERLVTGFGDRPAGALCPAALFAQPLDNEHVAVVQVAVRRWKVQTVSALWAFGCWSFPVRDTSG